MRTAVKVIPVRERPDLCAFFTPHFESEWPKWYGPNGKASAQSDLEEYANSAGVLPVGVVALDESQFPVGIAALRATSFESHSHLRPWAAAGFVIASRRRQGIGAALLRGLLVEASRLGHRAVFCATSTAVSLLEREGWTQIDSVLHDGKIQFVFQKAVPSAA